MMWKASSSGRVSGQAERRSATNKRTNKKTNKKTSCSITQYIGPLRQC
jgi:hypothetical protein